VEGARCSFTYQITDMPLLSTLYEPLSKQLISVLGQGRRTMRTASCVALVQMADKFILPITRYEPIQTNV